MMIRPRLLPLLIVCSLSVTPSFANEWFVQSSPIVQANKALLEDDIPNSFQAMIESWQSHPEAYVQTHLDQLALNALEKDCGRTWTTSNHPDWLDELIIEREITQRLGRLNYRLTISSHATAPLKQILFNPWSKTPIINKLASTDDQQAKWHYTSYKEQNTPFETGLYRLQLTTERGETWDSWVILTPPDPKQVVTWQQEPMAIWQVNKTQLLNPACPAPMLQVTLYQNQNEHFQTIWQKEYTDNYPTQIPSLLQDVGHYSLDVAMIHTRWQGNIVMKDKQVINKAYQILE